MALGVIPERLGTELSGIRKLAGDLARSRREEPSALHLVIALTRQPGPIANLLTERQISADRLLASAGPSFDHKTVPFDKCFVKATELARRMGVAEASSAHLLVALLQDSQTHTKRLLEGLGVDVARLRSLAWNAGLGYIRHKQETNLSLPAASTAAQVQREAPPRLEHRPRKRGNPGIAIPLVPPRAEPGKKQLGPAQPISIIPERAARPSRPEEGSPPIDAPVAASAADDNRAPQSAPSTEATSAMPRATGKRTRRPLERFELDPKRFAILTSFGRNLTLEAARGTLDPVVGREKEMEQTLDVLAKRHANCPCLVGPSGVGKTSIVRGLARRIVNRERTHAVDERIIVEIPVSELIAGTAVRGALAQRIAALRAEVSRASGQIVVFFDEIHLLFAADSADESGGELKLALARGEFPCIGATTPEDYRKTLENDAALARRFTTIEVEEPSREDAYLSLWSIAQKLETHHRVTFEEEALALAINWSIRYLPGRHLPDKAISMIDLSGAKASRRGHTTVTAEHVAEVVSEAALIPMERLLESDAERFLSLEKTVAASVVGHAAHIGKICSILRRNAAGLGSDRPIGTFLLLGPTGVGKTETAKAIAKALFHSESALVRIDMAEYSEPHTVARLIGAPPGYVGHDAGGQLTEAVRKRPYQVLLLDEIEKAHPDVLQSFLAVFDEGRLTDGKGRTVDFRNTVIFLTSNLGAEHTGVRQKRRVGFGNESTDVDPDVEGLVIASARARLSPELYNRLDEALVYTALSRSEIREIARRLLGRLSLSLAARDTRFEVTDSAIEHLIEQGGFDAFLGARPMKRTIARLIEAPLADLLLSGTLGKQQTVLVDRAGPKLSFEIRASQLPN